ncbi:unnamed protein product [Blepharisma stoltei]|uniref:Uncharacterized protein n=1 Tax=Blepharisma stoltei TaxID=1481888 RepID=A0AAU9J2V8_9CILI|nr:unnamed protein product [Blepharisma stoltei]
MEDRNRVSLQDIIIVSILSFACISFLMIAIQSVPQKSWGYVLIYGFASFMLVLPLSYFFLKLCLRRSHITIMDSPYT